MKKENIIAVLVILLAVVGIVITNYKPGTYLSGWDNLHPEFNFLEHFKRSIFSVWQEYQGVGSAVGSGYASDLPHVLLLWVLSWFLPSSFLRYTFHFLMLFVGTLGSYFVIKKHFNINIYFSLCGALFYLFNLGTLQYFTVPFEPFSVFWGMFPWLIYTALNFLNKPTRRNLFSFAIMNFLASPMFYVPTVFYVYSLVLCLLFMRNRIKPNLILIMTVIIVNSYWFLPHFYWFLTQRSVQQNAYINQLTTQETFIQSEKFGSLSDLVIFRNKPWEYRNFNKNGNQDFLMQRWHDHLKNPLVVWIGYTFFGISLLGLFMTRINRIFLLGLAAVYFISIGTQLPFVSGLNNLIRRIELINQVFRDPFTKFIVPAIFIFSIGFANGVEKLSKIKYSRFLIMFFLFIYMLPVFSGHLFADKMRVNIPQYYFDFFKFINSRDPSKRIANFPQGPVWGWTTYNWGYTGSGFLWYGINNPILDRAFDVWNDKNEEYYWELIYAINKKDINLFRSILEKYQISYVMFDSSVYFPDIPKFTTVEQKNFIEKSGVLKKIKTFGTISLYQRFLENSENQSITFLANVPSVFPDNKWLGFDYAFKDYGFYTNNLDSDNYINYSNRSLFSGRGSITFKNIFQYIFSINNPEHVINLPLLEHNEGYLVEVNSSNITGLPFRFWVEDLTSKRPVQQVYLKNIPANHTEYIIIPPYAPDGLGYALHFDNISIGSEKAINKLSNVTVSMIPYRELTQRKVVSNVKMTDIVKINGIINKVLHPKSYKYEVLIHKYIFPKNTLLSLSQGFDPGWQAFVKDGFFIRRLKNHVLVNNWENGWVLDQNIKGQKIVIFYWPQLLEFLGFLMLGVYLIWLLFSNTANRLISGK